MTCGRDHRLRSRGSSSRAAFVLTLRPNVLALPSFSGQAHLSSVVPNGQVRIRRPHATVLALLSDSSCVTDADRPDRKRPLVDDCLWRVRAHVIVRSQAVQRQRQLSAESTRSRRGSGRPKGEVAGRQLATRKQASARRFTYSACPRTTLPGAPRLYVNRAADWRAGALQRNFVRANRLAFATALR